MVRIVIAYITSMLLKLLILLHVPVSDTLTCTCIQHQYPSSSNILLLQLMKGEGMVYCWQVIYRVSTKIENPKFVVAALSLFSLSSITSYSCYWHVLFVVGNIIVLAACFASWVVYILTN